MDRQTTFADIEDASRKRATRREAFLEAMDAAVPWAELVAAVEPFYYPGRRGRRPMGVERMLRMYFLQLWFNLSDEGVEDAIYDSRAFSRFMGVSFGLGDRARIRPGRPRSGTGRTGAAGPPPHSGRESRKNGGKAHRGDRNLS